MPVNVSRKLLAAIAAVLLTALPSWAQDHQDVPRDQWRRPTDVFEALGLTEGSVVADLGAGGGWFTTRLARAVGSHGSVSAVGVDTIRLRELRGERTKQLNRYGLVRGA